MDLARVDMRKLARLLGLESLKGFELENDDPHDGTIILSYSSVDSRICKDQYVLSRDGRIVFTRMCSCESQSWLPSVFQRCEDGFIYREPDPVRGTLAGVILSALGENLGPDFSARHGREILSMKVALGLTRPVQCLGTAAER